MVKQAIVMTRLKLMPKQCEHASIAKYSKVVTIDTSALPVSPEQTQVVIVVTHLKLMPKQYELNASITKILEGGHASDKCAASPAHRQMVKHAMVMTHLKLMSKQYQLHAS